MRVDVHAAAVHTRLADQREPRVKKGGGALGVDVPFFRVVTCEVADGSIDFVVPSADEPIVAGYFKSQSGAN